MDSGTHPDGSRPDVVVVGGGLAGLAVAWRSAQRGLRVILLDPAPGGGASHAAAGMLAPVTEVGYGEEPLLRLSLDSAARYPGFVAEVEQAAGQSVGYRQEGTLVVALDADDRVALGELYRFQRSLGLAVLELSGRDCRRHEPLLAPGVRGGLLVEGDHSVDNRRLCAALLVAAARGGVEVRRQRATGLAQGRDGRVVGVQVAGGELLSTGTVVLAAGCWSGDLAGLPPGSVPVRPVKGQILRLRVPPALRGALTRTVRGTVRGAKVYLVPRTDGEVVVGATMEEQGLDTRVTAGAVYELLRDAHELLPVVTELELVESLAGLRPGTPDNAPLLGPGPLPGLVLATGHHRNGVLLTPVTGDAIAGLLADGTLAQVAAPFTPGRFGVTVPPPHGEPVRRPA